MNRCSVHSKMGFPCNEPSGSFKMCVKHRVYSRIQRAKERMAKSLGVKRNQIGDEYATLYAILQHGSPKSRG